VLLRRLVVLVCAVFLCGGFHAALDRTPATVLATGPCVPPRPASALDAEELKLVQLINQYRQQNGLAPLTLSPTLSAAAYWKSADMLANSYFAHDDLARSWSQRIADCGYTAAATIAENLAEGTRDAASTLAMWQNSPPHNANLLDPAMRAIGVGRAGDPSSQYTWYWTADFGGAVDGGTAAPSTSVSPGAGATASATPTPQPAPSLAVGMQARVAGTGDCLRIHAAPSLAAPVLMCLPDGFVVPISDGPRSADGYIWWQLGPLGWAVSTYLVSN